MTVRFWRACRWLVLALSIGLGSAGVARADVDITGDWDVVLPFGGFFMSVVQQGNVLTIQRPPFLPGGSGIIDPASGAFQMTFSDQCGVSTFSGTVTPDQHGMSGNASVSLVVGMGRCLTVSTTFTGTRRGCGDGVVGAGEQCDDGNRQAGDCCSATCQFEAAGTACPGTPGTCTRGACDGAGACDVTAPSVAPAGTVCRPPVGDCDVTEVCDGASPACPPDQIRPVGTVCRSATGPCDVAEVCDGSAAVCPPPTGPPDTDGDGIPDPCDWCPSGERAGAPRVKLATYDGTFGNDTLSLRARVPLAPAASLDPVTTGLVIQIGNPLGVLPGDLDLVMEPGPYNPVTRQGWTAARSGRAWRFTGGASLLAFKAQVKRARDSQPEVRITVSGNQGAYAVAPPVPPVAMTLAFGPPAAFPPCAEVVFDGSGPDAPTCSPSKNGMRLDCRGG